MCEGHGEEGEGEGRVAYTVSCRLWGGMVSYGIVCFWGHVYMSLRSDSAVPEGFAGRVIPARLLQKPNFH